MCKALSMYLKKVIIALCSLNRKITDIDFVTCMNLPLKNKEKGILKLLMKLNTVTAM